MVVEAPDEAAELGRRAVVGDGGERGVRRRMRRSKISWARSGRPKSRFSRMVSSRNTRPWTGRSKTWVSALQFERRVPLLDGSSTHEPR